MASTAKSKKQKRPTKTDKRQSERFKETARKLHANESPEDFDKLFRSIIPPKGSST